jgi:xylulose-5-phosphate/fructose-6-phosphate phosphoketolase
VKKRLLGHFGTTSGQNFIYVHLNRLIKERKLSAIYVAGPGHGGPAIVAQVYLEGTYTEYYPDVTRDEEGIGKLFKQFSFPGGIPSHVAPETPGSIHEGGELGYSLSHSFGAVLDKPDLTVFCVVGDGEAETGPLATSWHSNKFLNPITDGVVLPILHLNGFKIANPSVLSRIPMEELKALMTGYGYEPILVEGSSPAHMHPAFAAALNLCADKIKTIKENALLEQQQGKRLSRPTWPMIILKSPKGWTGPRTVDGVQIEGTFRSHQVPLSAPADNPDHLALLEKWLKSYEPEQQFDSNGRLVPELQALAPPPHLCMGNNRFTNPVIKPLVLPNFEAYAVNIDSNGRGETLTSNTFTVGTFLRDVIEKNHHHRNFRMFGPDETKSNKLDAIYEITDKQWMGESSEDDVNISTDGRMMEMLSEHQCEGWLEGYLLTGGHGLFNSYEAFIHIISSMFNQHAKWLETTKKIPWRNALSSLNILLSSHAWRQDHNGFTHQDPGFLSHAMTKKPEITRIYLPPDANCLLSVMHHCLQSRHYCNVMVAGKQQPRSGCQKKRLLNTVKKGLVYGSGLRVMLALNRT